MILKQFHMETVFLFFYEVRKKVSTKYSLFRIALKYLTFFTKNHPLIDHK